MPQPPQWLVSVETFTHRPCVLQKLGCEVGHRHELDVHVCALGQTWPHAPQLLSSEERLMQLEPQGVSPEP
jgi:hypothetical protein